MPPNAGSTLDVRTSVWPHGDETSHSSAPRTCAGRIRLRHCQEFVVFLIAAATFLPALHNSPFGDDLLLLDARLDASSARTLVGLFRESYWGDLHDSGLYRPLSLGLLGLERRAFDRDPAPYRAVNLLLHGLCSVLVLLLLRRLMRNAAAFAGAVLFAVHPVHAEAVITIYGQQDLLAALFFLAATVTYLGHIGTTTVRVMLVSSCYLLSVLCKEQGIFLPLLLLALRRYAPGPTRGHSIELRGADVGLLVAFAIYALLRTSALGSELVPRGDATVGYGYPWWARMNLAIVTVGTYLRLLVLPWGQTTYYGHLRDSIFGWPVVEFAVVLATLGLYAPLRQWLGDLVTQAYCFLAITLFPVANVIPIGTVVAERCLYLPSFVVCLLGGLAMTRVAASRARLGVALLVALSIAGVTLSARVAVRWRTPLAHWETTASDHPRSAGAHARFALLLLHEAVQDSAPSDDARFARAEHAISTALEINPRSPEAWQARGMLATSRGDCEAAQGALEQALALRPDDPQAVRLLNACR